MKQFLLIKHITVHHYHITHDGFLTMFCVVYFLRLIANRINLNFY